MLFMEPKDREINTPYSVYGNAAANDCLAGINDGHVCRLIIGEGERSFVADHVRLTDGRIAMASSKGGRTLLESTEAELGYGVAKARAYVYLPFDHSLFATDLENPRFADAGIDPDNMVPISVAEPVTDGGQPPNGTTQSESSARVKLFPPHLQKPRPIAFRSPSKMSIPGCINPHLSQYNTTLCAPLTILPEGITTEGGKNLGRISRTVERLLQTETDGSEGSSQ